MDDLVAWLRARLDEDEQWVESCIQGEVAEGQAARCATDRDEVLQINDRLRRDLAEVEAKRLLIEAIQNLKRGKTVRISRTVTGQPGTWKQRDHEDQRPALLRLLALPYADHPTYRDEWRP